MLAVVELQVEIKVALEGALNNSMKILSMAMQILLILNNEEGALLINKVMNISNNNSSRENKMQVKLMPTENKVAAIPIQEEKMERSTISSKGRARTFSRNFLRGSRTVTTNIMLVLRVTNNTEDLILMILLGIISVTQKNKNSNQSMKKNTISSINHPMKNGFKVMALTQ